MSIEQKLEALLVEIYNEILNGGGGLRAYLQVHDAEDAAQDAVLQLLEMIRDGRVHTSLRGLSYTVVRRRVCREFARQQRDSSGLKMSTRKWSSTPMKARSILPKRQKKTKKTSSSGKRLRSLMNWIALPLACDILEATATEKSQPLLGSRAIVKSTPACVVPGVNCVISSKAVRHEVAKA